MRAETHCRLIGVDIECMFPQSRDRRPDQSAAEAEDHAIIGKLLGWPARRDAGNGPIGDGEVDDVSHHQSHADRIEHTGQRHANATQICLVVAHPDGMPWRGIHDRYLHPVGAYATFVKRPRGPNRGPKTGEASPENYNALHIAPPDLQKILRMSHCIVGPPLNLPEQKRLQPQAKSSWDVSHP